MTTIFTYNIINKSIITGLTQYGETLTTLNIPLKNENDNTTNITSISNSAFSKNIIVTNITFANNSSINSIGAKAFDSCRSLKSIILPDGLQFIGESAFNSCRSLKSIILPDGLQSIGDKAFSACSLTSINIPSSVINIGINPFEFNNIISITTDNNNNSYFYIDNSNGGYILYTKNRLIYATPKITGNYNILSGKYGNITINITKIDDYACCYCLLTSINIPSSVTNIGMNPFELNNIISITTDNNNNSYFYIDNSNGGYILYTKNRLIYATPKITGNYNILSGKYGNITINITKIDDCACSFCLLTSIILPNGLQSIGDSAFSYCTLLSSINIPSSVTNIGLNPFISCTLTSITTDNNNNSYFYIDNSNGGYVLYTTDILVYATPNISGIYNILSGKYGNITIQINKIDGGAFAFCKITSINLNNNSNFIIDSSQSGEILYSNNGILLFATSNVINYNIPENIQGIIPIIIDPFSFSSCNNLNIITINSNIMIIKNGAFAKCNLTNIIINNNPNFYLDNSNNGLILYSKNDNVLIYSTNNITNKYTILPYIQSNIIFVLGSYAFYNCTKINTVVIPNTIYLIINTFKNCINLKTLIFNGIPPLFHNPELFSTCPLLTTIYYLPENASYWNPKPWWIPNYINLLPLPQYINQTLMYTTKNSLNFVITQHNNIFKLKKYFNNTTIKNNYQKIINNADLKIIASLFNN